jgi:hypothetical protein
MIGNKWSHFHGEPANSEVATLKRSGASLDSAEKAPGGAIPKAASFKSNEA